MSILTRFILIAGMAILFMVLSPIYAKQGNNKAAKLSKIGSVLVLVLALVKGIAVLVVDIGVFF